MNKLHLSNVLSRLQHPKELVFCDVTERHREVEERYICTVETNTGEKFVIKYYMNSYNTIQQVSGWARLATLYISHSLKVPQFQKFNNGEYAFEESIEGKAFLIWVEEFLHDEVLAEDEKIKNMTEGFYEQLGACLGKMHNATKQEKLNFPWNSPWVIFDKFCEDDLYDENYENAYTFYSELIQLPINHDRLNNVWRKYNEKRDLIEIGYINLPNGAVQGDLSINNILMNKDYSLTGVLDFNIAGNEVFVNHLMQEGIFLSFLSDTFWNTEDEMSKMLKKFERFINGYCTYYSLTKEELDIVDLLYQIIRPFRMEKVYSTIKAAKSGDYDEVNKRLEWMENELERTLDKERLFR